MADDQILGFDSVVANLPPIDAPSPRAQRVAAAVSMVQNGETYRAAAKATCVPIATIWDHVHGISTGSERDKGVKRAEQQIESLALANSIAAGEAILDDLQSGSMRPSEKIKAFQVAGHVAGRMLGWDKAADSGNERSRDALAGALQEIQEQLQQGAQITAKISIEQPDKAAEAIEVTSTEVET